MTKKNEVAITPAGNGWSLFAHELFLNQIDALIVEVELHRAEGATGYKQENAM